MQVYFRQKKQNQESAEDGKNNSGRMEGTSTAWADEQVSHKSAHQRTDDPQRQGPEERQMRMHGGVGNQPRDQTDNEVPD